MIGLVERYPGVIFLGMVVVLLLYGSLGGVDALYGVLGIDIEDHKIQRRIAAVVLTIVVLLATSLLVVQGMFLSLLGLAGLFALAFLVVRMLMVVLDSVTGRNAPRP